MVVSIVWMTMMLAMVSLDLRLLVSLGGEESVDLECESQTCGEPSGELYEYEQPKIGQSGCGLGQKF